MQRNQQSREYFAESGALSAIFLTGIFLKGRTPKNLFPFPVMNLKKARITLLYRDVKRFLILPTIKEYQNGWNFQGV